MGNFYFSKNQILSNQNTTKLFNNSQSTQLQVSFINMVKIFFNLANFWNRVTNQTIPWFYQSNNSSLVTSASQRIDSCTNKIIKSPNIKILKWTA